jgi:hypothetical protein
MYCTQTITFTNALQHTQALQMLGHDAPVALLTKSTTTANASPGSTSPVSATSHVRPPVPPLTAAAASTAAASSSSAAAAAAQPHTPKDASTVGQKPPSSTPPKVSAYHNSDLLSLLCALHLIIESSAFDTPCMCSNNALLYLSSSRKI